jgi:hypothetical protein
LRANQLILPVLASKSRFSITWPQQNKPYPLVGQGNRTHPNHALNKVAACGQAARRVFL